MTERARRRVDELLTELIELVETARAVPMSGSCVVPREHTLDLLDDLHGSLPAELAEARQVLARRDELLAEAGEHTARLVAEAEVRAHETVEAGRAEHAELVSASRVHQAATEQAAELHAAAEQEAAEQRLAAEREAAGLRSDATSFADQTLADLVDVLQQAMATTQQGRAALADRDHDRDERSDAGLPPSAGERGEPGSESGG